MFEIVDKEELDDDSPIRIIFEESTDVERIAEAIELLACFFGHDLHIVSAETLPPFAGHLKKAA